MRQLTLFFGLLLCGVCLLQAQNLEVQEITDKMSQGKHNGLQVLVYEASVDQVEDEWDKKLRRDFNANTSTKNGELFGSNATNDDISSTSFNVYTKIKESDQGVIMTVFVNLGGAYLNSSEHSDKFEAMKEKIQEFSNEVAAEAIEEQLDQAEDKLKDIEKEHKDLVDDKEDLQDDIEDYRETIEECQKKIEKAQKDIKKAKKEVEKKQEAIQEQQSKLEAQKKTVEQVENKLDKVD